MPYDDRGRWNDPLFTEEEYLEIIAEQEAERRARESAPATPAAAAPGPMRLRSGRAVRTGNRTLPTNVIVLDRSNTPERVDERPPLDFDEDDEYEAYDGPQYDTEQPHSFREFILGLSDRLTPIPESPMATTPSRQATPENAAPPPVRRRNRMSALFEEPPSKKRRIQILNVTEAATIRAEATETKSAVELSNCAICQEDDAPMDTVFTGCGHVSTCMSCTLRLVSDFNGRSIENGEARCPACRHVSIPVRLRAM